MKKFIFPVLLSFTMLTSCGQKKNENTSSGNNKTSSPTEKKVDPDVLVFEQKEYIKSYNDCKPSDSCAYFKINYIEATSGKIKDKLNAFITRNLIEASTIGDSTPSSMEAGAESFIESYASSRKDYPDMPGGWFWNYTIKQYGETSSLVCLGSESSTFMGGAHPNSYLAFYNFNKETGDTVSLTDMLVPGFETKLNQMIDRKFRKIKGLGPDDNLMDKAGLFENKITFTYNVGIDPQGNLVFFYNSYEIAPYASGPTMILIGKADLGDLINPKGPLK